MLTSQLVIAAGELLGPCAVKIAFFFKTVGENTINLVIIDFIITKLNDAFPSFLAKCSTQQN